MKKLMFIFCLLLCAVFAHAQDAINDKYISGEIVIPADIWHIEPSDMYTTLELRPAPSLTLEHDPNKYLRFPENYYGNQPDISDLLNLIEKLEARIEDLEARNNPGGVIAEPFIIKKEDYPLLFEAGSGVEIQESENNLTIINKKSAEADPEPTATIKPNGDLVITTPVTVGRQLDTIITKGEETWRIVATISAQLISQEEIANQILSIEAQIEAIGRQEQDLLKLKRRLNHEKKNKAKTKTAKQ